jgi:hypothetical protein
MTTTIEFIKYPTDEDWLIARNCALTTHRQSSDKTPSSKLKSKLLFSEHSPIRTLKYIWEWKELPYFISVHFVRHHEGITHFVSSQRNDIQYLYDRRQARQDSPVNHRCIANAQAILNISKARLCNNASEETQEAWKLFLDSLKIVSPELAQLCVKPCVYRNGICPEVFKCCGYNKTPRFNREVKEYLDFINALY